MNNPPDDSLFKAVTDSECRCSLCGAIVVNSTEARDAHLSKLPEPPEHRALYERASVAGEDSRLIG